MNRSQTWITLRNVYSSIRFYSTNLQDKLLIPNATQTFYEFQYVLNNKVTNRGHPELHTLQDNFDILTYAFKTGFINTNLNILNPSKHNLPESLDDACKNSVPIMKRLSFPLGIDLEQLIILGRLYLDNNYLKDDRSFLDYYVQQVYQYLNRTDQLFSQKIMSTNKMNISMGNIFVAHHNIRVFDKNLQKCIVYGT